MISLAKVREKCALGRSAGVAQRTTTNHVARCPPGRLRFVQFRPIKPWAPSNGPELALAEVTSRGK